MSATPEQHPFEIEVKVSAHGQPDAVLHREYVSVNSASTDKALGEVWGAVHNDTRARMRGVDDEK